MWLEDVSDASCVIVCTCGWRTIRPNLAMSRRAARAHEIACHPGSSFGHDRTRNLGRRHAEEI